MPTIPLPTVGPPAVTETEMVPKCPRPVIHERYDVRLVDTERHGSNTAVTPQDGGVFCHRAARVHTGYYPFHIAGSK